jgi:hypothetical protein
MRRLLVILAGVAMVSTGLACQHTAGKCDCEPPLPHCSKYGLYTPEAAAETIQRREMLPPVAQPKMIPTSGTASDISAPVIVTPSVGASGYGG